MAGRGSARQTVRSPEEETFRQYYNDLLGREIIRPLQLAELLFAEGIISNKTKESVTSDVYVEHKRVVLDAVQHALASASNPEKMFQTLLIVLRKTGFDTYWMEQFNAGECTISSQACT